MKLNQKANKNATTVVKKIKIGVVLIVFAGLFQLSFAQPVTNSAKEISDTMSKAEAAGKIWTGESVEQMFFLHKSAIDAQIRFGQQAEALANLRKLAWLEIRYGRFDPALKLVEEAKILEKKLKDSTDTSLTKSLECFIYFRKNDLPKCQAILPKIEISGNSGSTNKAIFHYLKAEISYDNRDFAAAQNDYDKAIENWQVANDNENLSYTLIDSGYNQMFVNPRFGIEKIQRAEKHFNETGNNRGLALSLIAIGVLHSYLDEEQTALDYFIRAENLFPNDIDFIERARLFNGIGRIYEEFGKSQLSLDYREKAFISFGKANYEQGQISTLPSLVRLSYDVGKIALAEGYYKNLLTLSQKQNNYFFLGVAEKYVGDYFFYQGNYQDATSHYQKVMLYTKDKNNEDGIIQTENNLGIILIEQNKFDESRNYLENALRSSRKIQHKFGIAQTLFNLAKLSQLENNLEKALINIKESINLTESLYSDVANSNLQRSYFSSVYDRYELYIHLLMQKYRESQNQDFLIQALQASEKSRSRSLLETLRLSEANFTKDANPELVAKEKELRNLWGIKVGKLTDLLNAEAEKTEIEEVETEIRTLENDLESIKAELKQNSPVYSAVKNPTPFDVADFQKNILDDKTILLEFALGERESYLWIVSKNEVSHVVLPTRDVIENRIDRIHKNFESRQSLPNEEIEVYQQRIFDLEKEFDSESKLLSHDLLGQISDKIKNKRLIVIPDGKLALLPISALPLPNSDNPVILHHEVVYEPSASLLNILANLQTSKQTPTKDLLIFADPVFNQTDNRLAAKSTNESNTPTILGLNLRDFRLQDENGNIPRLFATQNEADSIIKIVGQSRAVLATGFSVNRDRVLNSDISDYRILHFATHGLVDVNRPEISSIVLSQFDENGNKLEGFLRLQDIYSLNLTSDLVVLSACRSGIGKEIKGEGLMSLNNAFLQAGAKSVMSSAWKVDDTATAELMKYFYANLTEKNLTPANALREAQLKMLNSGQFKSPFYWAAFTIQGEFRQPLSIKNSYFYYYLIPIFIILGLIAVWRFRKVKI